MRWARAFLHCVAGGREIAQARVCPGRMVNEEVPGAILPFAMHLHAVVMDFNRLAILVLARDEPLRAGHREIARDGRMMGHDIHVQFKVDVGGHGRANAFRAASDLWSAMHLIDLDDRRLGVIEGGCSLDVLRIERAGEPQIAEFRAWRTRGDISFS